MACNNKLTLHNTTVHIYIISLLISGNAMTNKWITVGYIRRSLLPRKSESSFPGMIYIQICIEMTRNIKYIYKIVGFKNSTDMCYDCIYCLDTIHILFLVKLDVLL